MKHSFTSAQAALRGALCLNPTTSSFRFLMFFLGVVFVSSFSSCELFGDQTEDISGHYVMTIVDRSVSPDFEPSEYSGDGILMIGECEQFGYETPGDPVSYHICHTENSYLLLRADNTFQIYWEIAQGSLVLIAADNVEGTYTHSEGLLTLTTMYGTEYATVEDGKITWIFDEDYKFTFEK